ncbi:TonB-dependent receptor [Marinilabiliaceae bacterium ANBcel2]|nr:TonB-dependent receptor [Marinilabiliaceae bacterium ANBcel2]
MKIIALLIILMAFPAWLKSQDVITGQVVEEKEEGNTPVAGANIYWANTTIGVSTNTKGEFEIKRNNEHTKLVVSFIGHQMDTIAIDENIKHLEITIQRGRELDEVNVTARQRGTYISRANPITTIEITSNELCKAACCSLAESFETNASVDVSYTDAATGAKQIQLLGLSGKYVQMLTENMRSAEGPAKVYELDHVPGPWMESIQVSKGAASVTNGYESLTGQINVEYKKPEQSEKFFLNGFTSSSGRIEGNANKSLNIGEKWSSTILAHASTDTRKHDHNNNGFLDEPYTNRYILMNRWHGRLSSNIFLQTGIKFLNEERTSGQKKFNRSISPSQQDAYGIIIDSKNIEAFLKASYTFKNDPESSIALVQNYSHYDQNSIYGHRYYDIKQNYFATNLILNSHFGEPKKQQYTIGIDHIYNNLNEELTGDLTNIFAEDGSRTHHVKGAYLQYKWAIPKKITLLSGIRADHSNHYGAFITPRMHLNYTPNKHWSIRASAGKGYRTPYALAENNNVLASSRNIYIDKNIDLEEGWNYGINIARYIHINNKELIINAEAYQTRFKNQLIIDMDQSAREIHFGNLNGRSYSNIFQVEASMEVIEGLEMLAAYRLNRAKTTTNERLQRNALQSRYRSLFNVSYLTPKSKWQFDFTAQVNGSGRIPTTKENPVNYQQPQSFNSYSIFNSQLTKFIGNWDFYLGVENIGDFTQNNPIIAADSPFSNHFDSSLIWGPVMGRKIYFGFRFNIDSP